MPVPQSEGEDGPLEVDSRAEDLATEFGFSNESKELKLKTHIRMPLTSGVLKRFQLVHRSFRTLAQTILFTLRLELRLQTYYYIGATFREGSYYLSSSDSIEPDANIIELSSSISNLDSAITGSLPQSQKDFVLCGLALLLNRLLIENVVKLTVGNEWGFKKMCRNVLALQQSMKTLRQDEESHDGDTFTDQLQQDVDRDFEPSRKFWEMAAQGPKAVMAALRSGANYSFEQYRHLLCLLCTIDPTTATPNSVNPADVSRLSTGSWTSGHGPQSPPFDKRKRIYNECLIELHALVFEDDEDEDDA